MEVLLGWIIFSILAGWIASNKGRSGIGVFFLSLILSPLVGVIVAFAMKSGDKLQTERAVANGEYRKRPMCAEMSKAEALKCKHCGSAVQPAEPSPPKGFAERPTGLRGM